MPDVAIVPATQRFGIDYRCDRCGVRYKSRDDLIVVRKEWREMGDPRVTGRGKVLRSRVVEWICKERCLPTDPDFNSAPFRRTPGFRHTKLSREGVDDEDASPES